MKRRRRARIVTALADDGPGFFFVLGAVAERLLHSPRKRASERTWGFESLPLRSRPLGPLGSRGFFVRWHRVDLSRPNASTRDRPWESAMDRQRHSWDGVAHGTELLFFAVEQAPITASRGPPRRSAHQGRRWRWSRFPEMAGPTILSEVVVMLQPGPPNAPAAFLTGARRFEVARPAFASVPESVDSCPRRQALRGGG